jgi:hypothetical protein
MMNGCRKSDSCVVPAKSANKLMPWIRAEQMERRRLVKGKVGETRRQISPPSRASLIVLVSYWRSVIPKISRASFTKWIGAVVFSSTLVATITAPRLPLLTLFVQDQARPSPPPAPGRK